MKKESKLKRKEKLNQGITLIALVITIIVLLILAGVAIATLTGDNGILTKANNAKTETEIASIKEEIQTEILAEQAGNQGSISEDTLKRILETYGVLSEEEKLIEKTLTTTKGNYEIKVADIFNGTTVKDVPKNPIFTKVANEPNISGFNKEKTYYVSWDLTNSPYQINEDTNLNGIAPSNWYDYTEGVNHWANVKTTGGGNDCYWVWIPRYAYKVPTKGSTAETIELKFLQGTSKVPIGETEEITNTIPTPGLWVVHPAFTNEGNGGFGELEGIWVAKYEASSSSVNTINLENGTLTGDTASLDGSGGGTDISLHVRVKPNVTSWRNITMNNIFILCKNLTTSGNSLEEATGIDSHMMKNTEWGAIAYLSRSVYGKNSAVWNNPYYNNTTNYSPITGLAGDSQDASQTNLTNTYRYNEVGGGNASTTGNVHGVYDMAGGAWEYVAGYLDEVLANNSTLRANSQSLYDAEDKYKDKYIGTSSTDTANYSANQNKYGDAMYETSTSGTGTTSWDTDYSLFLNSSYMVFNRGGRVGNAGGAGVFAFGKDTGGTNTCISFRPCLVLK